jgi:putative transposase
VFRQNRTPTPKKRVKVYLNSWKLSADRRQITFTDGFEVGTMDLWSSRDLVWYSEKQISRVRVIRRADGYYAQFLIDWDRREEHEFQGKMTGIDLGLKEFYTDSNGNTVGNPRYLRKSERRLKRLQRRVSKKHKSARRTENQEFLGIPRYKSVAISGGRMSIYPY